MQPTRVTSSEFQQAFGALSDKARREPVVITKARARIPLGRHGGGGMGALETPRSARRPDDRTSRGMGRGRSRRAKVPDEYAHLDADLTVIAVPLPKPIPGLVIRYSYLWRRRISRRSRGRPKGSPLRHHRRFCPREPRR